MVRKFISGAIVAILLIVAPTANGSGKRNHYHHKPMKPHICWPGPGAKPDRLCEWVQW